MTFSFARLRKQSGMPDKLIRLIFIALSAVLSLALSHFCLSDHVFSVITNFTPPFVKEAIMYLIPIAEANMAYDIMIKFVDPVILNKQLAHLLFVTLNIQVGLGFLGIDFLKKEQQRRNQLVRLDVDDESAKTVKSTEDISKAEDRCL